MDYNNTEEKQPHLPKGASLPRNQVAGHKHEGRTKLGLLQSADGQIVKAIQKAPRGTRELEFYRQIFDKEVTDKCILQLRQFLPHFYGAYQFDEYPEVTYIKLENLVSAFRNPCVVDIKMGKKTYDPEAIPTKIEKEMNKFPHVEKFGFQLAGMQVYDPVQQKIIFYDKYFGRKLDDGDFLLKGLGTYFNIKCGLRKDAIRMLLKKLLEIEKWFLTQRKFAFYASSLLMIYEGDMQINGLCTRYNHFSPENTDSTGNLSSASMHSTDLASTGTASSEMDSTSNQTDGSSLSSFVSCTMKNAHTTTGYPLVSNHDTLGVDLRMIDFTHTFMVNEQDDNYLYGLQTLISYLQQLLNMEL